MSERSDLFDAVLSRRRALQGGAALGFGVTALGSLRLGGVAAQDATTVNLLHSIPPETETFMKEQLMPGFASMHPECTVNVENYGTENATTVRTRVQAGGDSAPDLSWLASTEQGIFSEAGLLADVDSFLAGKPDVRDKIIPSLLELSSYGGKVTTIPWTTNNLAVYINKSAFDAAGVPIPSKDPAATWTWAEFADAAKKLTTDSMKGFLMTVGGGWDTWVFHAWLAQAGGTFLAEDGTPGFNGPEGVEAMTFLKGLVDAGVTAFSEPDKGFETAPWLAQTVAMHLNGPWNFGSLKDLTEFEFDIVPYPRGKQPATNLGGNQLYIFDLGEERVACSLAFGEYVLSDEFQTKFTIQDGSFPTTTTAAESEEYQAHLKQYPWLLGWLNQTPYGVARSSLPQYTEVSTVFSDQYDEIMLNGADIQEALNNAAEEAESFKG